MSILETDKVDAIGIAEDGTAIALMLADHLDWSNEYEHLLLLQKKINAYLAYLEDKQYQETYPNHNFSHAVITIYFKHDIPQVCEKFLQVVQDQVGELGVEIQATIAP